MIAGTNTGYEDIEIRNLGPNAVYVEVGAAAAVATGTPIPATSGTLRIRRSPGQAVNVIAATALQVSPADTRYLQQ